MSKEKNDLTLKIFALVIAVLLWVYVMSEVDPTRPETIRNIQVDFLNLEAIERQSLIVMDPKEAKISVEISGKNSELLGFDPKDIKASVDLKGYSEGQKKVPVMVNLETNKNIKIDNYYPKEILVTFDRVITKERQVIIKTTGELETGYVLGDITSKNKSILLKGPKSWINEVMEVAAIVDLTGRREDDTIPVPIRLLDSDENDVVGITKEPTTVDVTIPILRSKSVPIEVVFQGDMPEGKSLVRLETKPKMANIKGDQDIKDIARIYTKPVDVSRLLNSEEIKLDLDLPENVSLIEPTDVFTLDYEIKESKSKTFTYSLSEVNILGLESNLYLENNRELIEVTLTASEENINKLTKEDIVLSLNLNNKKEGSHDLDFEYLIPDYIEDIKINPSPINLKIISE